ncbi:TPA: ash family protein [Escherichia coli]|nr:ash family protein [Escherichia coli]
MWLSLLKSRRIDMNAPLVDTFRAVAKSTTGIGTPIIIMAHTALAVFLCVKHCYTPIMVGRAGES